MSETETLTDAGGGAPDITPAPMGGDKGDLSKSDDSTARPASDRPEGRTEKISSAVREAFKELSADPEPTEESDVKPKEGEDVKASPDAEGSQAKTQSEKEKGEAEEKDAEKTGEDKDQEGKPPAWFTAEAKAAYLKLTPDQRKLMEESVKGATRSFTKKTMEVADLRKELTKQTEDNKSFVENVGKWSNVLQSYGSEPGAAFDQFMQIDAVLRRGTDAQKSAQLSQIIETYGLQNLAAAATKPDGRTAQTDQPGEQEFVDPEISRVNSQLQAANERIAQLEANLENDKRQSETQAHQGALDHVTTFASAENDDGSLAHPHMSNPDVVKQMARDISADKAEGLNVSDLAPYYERAVMAVPETREAVLQERAELEKAKRAAQADEAKRRAAVNVDSRAGAVSSGKGKSLSDLVREGLREQRAAS